MSELFLIVGLGNPGEEYKNTRHNVGFCCVDMFLDSHNLRLDKSNFKCFYTKTTLFDKDVIIAEPQTYMNNSGESLVELVNFFKIDKNNIIVIQDDMDIDVGRVRMKPKGSCGGHNGIRSIVNLLGTEDIKRIKVGIGKPQYNVIDFVLSRFSKEDQAIMNEAYKHVVKALDYTLTYNFDKAMSKFNT